MNYWATLIYKGVLCCIELGDCRSGDRNRDPFIDQPDNNRYDMFTDSLKYDQLDLQLVNQEIKRTNYF